MIVYSNLRRSCEPARARRGPARHRASSRTRALAALAVVAVLASAPAGHAGAPDFDAGLAAYNAADFERAFAKWLPLAVRGDAKAQASLGYLYFRGLGVPRDGAVAARWFSRAAEQGQPTAQFFLGTLYYLGRGIERDLVRAHLWCELALSNGLAEGLECKDEVARHMSAREMRESDRLLVEWRRRNRAGDAP